MKSVLIIIAIAILVGVGCVERPSPTVVPYVEPEPKPSTNGITASTPILIVEPKVTGSLYIKNARVRDVGTTTAILEYDTTIPSLGTIILIAAEKEFSRYYTSIKATTHYQSLTNLKPSTLYTVVIEATGSDSDRTVFTFNTLTPVEMDYGGGSYGGYGGYYFPTPSGNITGAWHDGDGSFNGSIWEISAYPAEVKHCRIKVVNYLGYSVTVKLIATPTENPVDGENKVLVSGSDLIVVNGTEVYFEVSASVLGDAPIGLYKFNLELGYE